MLSKVDGLYGEAIADEPTEDAGVTLAMAGDRTPALEEDSTCEAVP